MTAPPHGVLRTSVMNGDVQLHLERVGDGPTRLLFVHGWLGSRRLWYDCVARLPPRRYTSLLLDVRGCGLSDRPLEGHDLDGYVGDVRAALRREAAPTYVVGHSMGGRIALRLATEAPAELAGLVLVAPGSARGASVVPRQRELASRAFGSRRRVAGFQRGAIVAPVDEAAMERLIDDALIAQREHWFGWYDAGRVGDFSAAVPTIRVPTVVVAGEADPLVPPGRLARELVAAIPGARLHAVPDCGHLIPLERPQAIVDAIAQIEGALPRG